MSKRRNAGDWVWLMPNSGFVGESNRLKVELQPDTEDLAFCSCGDHDCQEWDCWTEPDPQNDGKRHLLCHVSECRMLDERWSDQ